MPSSRQMLQTGPLPSTILCFALFLLLLSSTDVYVDGQSVSRAASRTGSMGRRSRRRNEQPSPPQPRYRYDHNLHDGGEYSRFDSIDRPNSSAPGSLRTSGGYPQPSSPSREDYRGARPEERLSRGTELRWGGRNRQLHGARRRSMKVREH